MMRLTRFFGWSSWISGASVALMFGAACFGPAIEARFFPIRGPQSVVVVERSAARLCWDWTYVKLRGPGSDNLDGFLEVNGEQGGNATPYDAATGRPWGILKYAAEPRAAPYTQRMCIPLPPYVAAGDALRVRQTAYYPGFLGLWRLPVPFPDVVSGGAK